MPVERGARKLILLILAFLVLVSLKHVSEHFYGTKIQEPPSGTAMPLPITQSGTIPPRSTEVPPTKTGAPEEEAKNAFFPDMEVYGEAPEFSSPVWLNSEPLTMNGLEGKVVLLTFWTWTCERCVNSIPTLNGLQERHGGDGLVVIAFHGPSLPTDRNGEKVREIMEEHGIRYLVALDNDYQNWNNYGVSFTPTRFLIDKGGRIRHIAIGDWGFEETEEVLTDLLEESR